MFRQLSNARYTLVTKSTVAETGDKSATKSTVADTVDFFLRFVADTVDSHPNVECPFDVASVYGDFVDFQQSRPY